VIDTTAAIEASIATWHDIDHADGRSVHRHFTSDGQLTLGARTFRGRDAITAMYAERAAPGTRVARHVVTNFHRVESSGHDLQLDYVLCLFASDGELPLPITVPTSIADVTDCFVMVGGVPLISSRTLRFVFVDPHQRMAVPTQ
jgi:hypothetical protein